MKTFLKIIFLLLAIFPIWLTILAVAEPEEIAIAKTSAPDFSAWKEKFNERLLEIENRRIQILEISKIAKGLEDRLLKWPNSQVQFDLSHLKSQQASILGVEFRTAEGTLEKFLKLPVKAMILEEVNVASHSLARGAYVNNADLRQEWRDLSTFRGPIARSEEAIGHIVRNPIQEGDLVYVSSLEKDALIRQGDRVKILVTGAGVTLSAIGIARESGTMGQSIRVINSDSKKEFTATVRSSEEVEVKL